MPERSNADIPVGAWRTDTPVRSELRGMIAFADRSFFKSREGFRKQRRISL
jgi:hypothetical protein